MIFKKAGRPNLSSYFLGTGTVKGCREETLRMFSIADMAVAGAVALLLFGPDQLPKVARRAGQLVRDVQNTSQSFIREMERAADEPTRADITAAAPASSVLPAAPAYHETPTPAHHAAFESGAYAVFEPSAHSPDVVPAAPPAAGAGAPTLPAAPPAGVGAPTLPAEPPGSGVGAPTLPAEPLAASVGAPTLPAAPPAAGVGWPTLPAEPPAASDAEPSLAAERPASRAAEPPSHPGQAAP
jgi:Sec-independent protein translocase protein TatA